MFGFTCNLRAIYMRVDYEKPLDTAKSIFESGKTVNIYGGGFYPKYLGNSDNPWHRKIVAKASFYKGSEARGNILKKILTDGNDVMVGYRVEFIGWLTKNQEFQKIGNVHLAKESIISSNLAGWAVQKNSPWLEALNKHILTLDQAINN